MEVKITTENFETYKNGELPLVVDLWATWCGPCRFGVRNIPTILFFKGGQLVDKYVGAANKETLDEKFKQLL